MYNLKNNEKIAIPIVLFAGLMWSFGPLVVRYIDQPNLVPWQYLFTRGIVIFCILNIYLYFDEGKGFYKNYFKVGRSGFVGGLGLGVAMICFIWSITNTSAAITLLCLAAMPFMTALLGFLFLKEKISLNVWIAIIIAVVGIVIMALGNTNKGSLMGFVFGMISALGFSVFSVSLRWRKETPKFTTVAVAGIFCAIISSIMLLSTNSSFISSSNNEGLFALHGTIVCLGMIFYTIGSKAIPAAELTLLSLTEVIGGIFWVWLPIFGINEVPTNNTIIGGFLIFMSIIYYSLTIKTNRRFIALN
jgi:drug/metabolite transporter, DME family